MTDQVRAVAVVRRIVGAAPHIVYREWLDTQGLSEWMCPHPARPIRIELDARVGGRLLIDIDDQGFELSITGRYLELDEPRRLSFTWNCSTWDPPTDSIVTVTFEPLGDDRTLMTIHHEQLPPDLVDGHQYGWMLIADQLEDRLTGAG